MAQTGFTPIQLFRTSTAAAAPTAGNLADGELAINLTDEKLYFKNAAGTVKLLAANITAVANGGTGATTAGDARTNLGSTTLGSNLFTITNPGAVTFPRFNADNTVSSLNAADFRTAIGAGTGGGDVTLAGVQTLTNKTIAFADNTLTGVAGTTATQTLTNKTLAAVVLNDGYTEEVFAVTGTTPALSPTNGSIQTWTLSGNSTPTAGTWASGQSLTLMVDDDTAYTIDWSSVAVTWKTNGGAAPTLNTTGFTAIQLWKVDTVIYGARVGDA
jgi:hypothetical protein